MKVNKFNFFHFLTFITLSLWEYRFISGVSQMLFARAFHLQCVAAQWIIGCFTFYLLHKVNWLLSDPPSFCASFLCVHVHGDSVDFRKVRLKYLSFYTCSTSCKKIFSDRYIFSLVFAYMSGLRKINRLVRWFITLIHNY